MKILHSIILGEGKPLLILHGFLGMSDNWKTLGHQFSENGFQVHLIDQRNHGKSFHSEEFNYRVMVEDIFNYSTHYQLKNISLIGHSMGGKTAMFFATAYPQLMDKLIILDMAPKYYPQHHQKILEGLNAINFNTINSRSEVDEILSKYVPDFSTRQFLLKNLYWKDKNKMAFRFYLNSLTKNSEEMGEALPEASRYQGKTLFLKGERSNYITKEDEHLIKRHFPNAVIDEVKNAGHWIHAEQPKAFLSKSLHFLHYYL
jgi:esterase